MLEIGWYQYFTVRKKLGRFFLIFSIFLPLVIGEWYMYVSLAFRALLQLLWMEEQKIFFVCFRNKIHTQESRCPHRISRVDSWHPKLEPSLNCFMYSLISQNLDASRRPVFSSNYWSLTWKKNACLYIIPIYFYVDSTQNSQSGGHFLLKTRKNPTCNAIIVKPYQMQTHI